MKHFLIGDEVYVPKHKMLGTVVDKRYEHDNDEIMLLIDPKEKLSNVAFGNSMRYMTTYVNYSTVKSLKTSELYQKKILHYNMDDEKIVIDDLNIPNLLQKKDIIEGTKIKVVDNYMLEKLISYPRNSHLYSKLVLSYLLNKDAVLTGSSTVLPNGVLAVECKFDYCTYYVYQHSIQLVKRANVFKRVFSFFKKLPKGSWIIIVYGIAVLLTSMIYLIVKLIH